MTVPTLDTTTLEQANQARTVQLALASAAARDTARLWPALNPQNLDGTFPNWLRLMVALVTRYQALSAHAAGIYYRDARQAVVGKALDDIRTAPPAQPQLLERAFGFSGPGVLRNDNYQPGSALSITQGTAARLTANGGRDTILANVKADPKALGWYRVTDGHPCAFCALLASRGAVYKKTTADFKTHNDCGCTSAPLFDRSQPLPEITGRAEDLYRAHVAHLPNPQRLAAFRKVWDSQTH